MKQQLLPGSENIACNLELTLINTKEELESAQQEVKQLRSLIRDKESQITFLQEILSARTTLVFHQVNTIAALQEKLKELTEKTESPVIVMKNYLPEISEEQIGEAAI